MFQYLIVFGNLKRRYNQNELMITLPSFRLGITAF